MSPIHATIVIPAFNEEDNIGPLILDIAKALHERYLFRIIVVDDGSSDRTSSIARSLAATVPINLIRHPTNLGLGASLRDGLLVATLESEQYKESEVVVTLDGDRSHSPMHLPAMIEALNHRYDVAVASRYCDASLVIGVPLKRRVLSRVASGIFSKTCGIPSVRDYTCGYRVFRAGILRSMFSYWGNSLISSSGFTCTAELLIKAYECGAAIIEVPFVLRYDLKAGQSKMRIGSTIHNSLLLLARHKLHRNSRTNPVVDHLPEHLHSIYCKLVHTMDYGTLSSLR